MAKARSWRRAASETGLSPLALGVQSTVPLAWLSDLALGFAADGDLRLLGFVRGSLGQPVFDGQASVRSERLVLEDFPHAFRELAATALLYPDRIVLDRAEAQLGGGTVLASGRVDLPSSETPPAGAGPQPHVELNARVTDVSLRYPEPWEVRGDAEVAFRQTTLGERVLVGNATLETARYGAEVDLGFAQLLRSMFARQTLEVRRTEQRLASVRLDLAVLGEEALRIDNDLAQLRADIDLRLGGTLARPSVFGDIEMVEGGVVEYGGEEYTIRRGQLSFSNPYQINPLIDVIAATRRRDYEIVLNLSGTRERLDASFSSDPPLPEVDVLSLIAAGGRVRFCVGVWIAA